MRGRRHAGRAAGRARLRLRRAQGRYVADVGGAWQFLAAQGMAKQYWPERLELLPEMPRTPSDKIQKVRLRELAANFKR
jgi:acyl-coenzyme A synthetase/AMP-(fatty) acid ligase